MQDRTQQRIVNLDAYAQSRLALTAIERRNCAMTLVRIARRPSGFDIRTFDCGECNHAHILTVAID
jgi:hypothetical protein